MVTTDADRVARHPGGWSGTDLVDTPGAWMHTLSSAEIDELEVASAAVEGLDRAAIDRANFALPTLGVEAARWAEELRTGRGFVAVRGLPVDRWTTEQARTAFLGLGHHLGAPIRQNADGELVADVRAERASGDPSVRRYQTSEETPFHTDGSDMIALFCLQQGRSGGQSAIVSSVAVIDTVAAARPDLVPMLFEPWPFAMTADAVDHFELPLLASRDPFSFFYVRWYIEQSLQVPAAPRLTAEHRELLDLIDATADEHRLDIDFLPGDVQLLSNRTVMHARTVFVDWDDPARRRHLLRLWLSHHGTDVANPPA